MFVVILASLKNLLRRTLYDPYCPYFLPKEMLKFPRKVKGHFMTLIKVGRTRFKTVL